MSVDKRKGMYPVRLVRIVFRECLALNRILFTLLLFVVVTLLVSCQPSDRKTFRGYLYFTQGSYLMRLGLRDSSLEAVVHLGNNKIREISDFGQDRLLISETAFINRRRVARISWLDLDTGRAQAMYSGVKARYVATADAIVYDDGGRVYTITQADGIETASHVMSHKRHQLSAMVEVSDGRLLIETLEDEQPVIHSLRVEDGTLISLDGLGRVCRLKGAVWIDDLEQLACIERTAEDTGNSRDYVFADLDGRILSRPSFPEGETFLALAYVSNQGALILKESWRSQLDGQQKSAVWVHDVRSGENHELSDTLDLGSSVVYSVH